MTLKMTDTRIILSPLFDVSQGVASGFANKIDHEMLNSYSSWCIRLLSFYSPIAIPATKMYLTGLRRKLFGRGHEDDFFYLGPVLAGERRESFHKHLADVNIHGVLHWEVKLKSARNISEMIKIPKGTVIEFGLSPSTDQMKSVQYLPFVLSKDDLQIRFESFQRIDPHATVGLVDVFVPPLANVFPPFNYIKASSSKRQHSTSNSLIGGQEVIVNLPVDFYSKHDMWKHVKKFLSALGCKFWMKDERLVCGQGEMHQRIILHKDLVAFWDVRGSDIIKIGNESSFSLVGLSFGQFDEISPFPNPMILECDLLQHTMVGLKPYRLLRMLFPETRNGLIRNGCSYVFDNIQMIKVCAYNVSNICFKLMDRCGNDIYFASDGSLLSGTLVIHDA